MLSAPDPETLKANAIARFCRCFYFMGCDAKTLMVRDLQVRRGVPHVRVHGKGGKTRYVPTHPQALDRIEEYLDAAGHREQLNGALFRSLWRVPVT